MFKFFELDRLGKMWGQLSQPIALRFRRLLKPSRGERLASYRRLL